MLKRIFLFLIMLTWLSLKGMEIPGDSAVDGFRKEKHPVVHQLGVAVGLEYVASSMVNESREEVLPEDRISVHSALPLHLKYAFRLTDPSIPHYLPGGYQGVGVGVMNFGGMETHGLRKSSVNIGYPVLVYIFQGGPFHKINDKVSLGYEWNFGASFGWKPYGRHNKNFNLTVDSRVNAYLNLAFTASWRINEYLSLLGGVGITHFSNGNTSYPNPGVNSFGLRLGMEYAFNPRHDIAPLPVSPKMNGEGRGEQKYKLEYDIMGWGATRKRLYRGIDPPVVLPGHFACAGLSFSPMVRLDSWWRVGGSLDIQWDRSSDMERNYIGGDTTEVISFRTPSFWRQVNVGISAHGELRMPIFALNLGCGVNLVAPPEHRGTYQNIALKTYLYKGLFINVGYQLRNFHQQGSLMLGAGYTI